MSDRDFLDRDFAARLVDFDFGDNRDHGVGAGAYGDASSGGNVAAGGRRGRRAFLPIRELGHSGKSVGGALVGRGVAHAELHAVYALRRGQLIHEAFAGEHAG